MTRHFVSTASTLAWFRQMYQDARFCRRDTRWSHVVFFGNTPFGRIEVGRQRLFGLVPL